MVFFIIVHTNVAFHVTKNRLYFTVHGLSGTWGLIAGPLFGRNGIILTGTEDSAKVNLLSNNISKGEEKYPLQTGTNYIWN